MTTTTKYVYARHAGYFLWHLGEMILAMIPGIVAGGAVLALIFSTVLASTIRGMTRIEVLNQFAVLICLVMAVGMIVPMVAWMRVRGMEWRPILEMAAAMAIPLLPIFGLLGLQIIPGAWATTGTPPTRTPPEIVPRAHRSERAARGVGRVIAPRAA